MVTYFTQDPMQVDFVQYLLDKNDVPYETVRTDEQPHFVLVVDGVPLDYGYAVKWILEKEIKKLNEV